MSDEDTYKLFQTVRTLTNITQEIQQLLKQKTRIEKKIEELQKQAFEEIGRVKT